MHAPKGVQAASMLNQDRIRSNTNEERVGTAQAVHAMLLFTRQPLPVIQSFADHSASRSI